MAAGGVVAVVGVKTVVTPDLFGDEYETRYRLR